MSVTGSTKYSLLTKQRQKMPLYFVSFGQVGDGVLVPALDDEFCTGDITNPTKTRKRWLSIPQGTGQNISELSGSSTISDIQFTIQDRGGWVTKWISRYPMKNRICTLYGGYVGLDESQFIPIFKGQISSFGMAMDAAAYTFTVTDFHRLAKGNGFGVITKLHTQMNPVDQYVVYLKKDHTVVATFRSFEEQTTWYMANFQRYIFNGGVEFVFVPVTQAIQVSPPPFPSSPWFAPMSYSGTRGPVNLVQVDDELMLYTSVKLPTGDEKLATIVLTERGLYGSEVKKHDPDAEVKQVVVLDGNPLTVMLWLMLSINGDGANGPYDVLPTGQGAGIPQEFVNVTEIEQQRDRFLSGFRIQLFMSERTEIKKLIQDEILKPFNGYPLVKNDGRLSVRMFYVPLPTDVVATLDDSNIIGVPSFQMAMESKKSFFNQVKVKFDFEPVSGEFLSERIVVDMDSVQKADEFSTIAIESKGIRKGTLHADQVVDRYAQQIFTRYRNGCPTITLNAFYSTHLIELGDYVAFRSKYVPNLNSGSRGDVGVICEVVNKSNNYQSGQIQFTLRATGYTSNKRWFIICPDGYPTYDLATDDQKKRGFISQEIAPGVATMLNGDAPYVITP